MSIPNIIHYCWFGGTKMPKSAIKCINSWKKYFPGYEIKEWNESNFDCECCDYVKEAYQAKKWAFVSDYARFWILYNYGGIYFDTDVEVIKSFQPIIENGAFMGCEVGNLCAPGLGLGASVGLNFYKEILDYYEKLHYIDEKGMRSKLTVVDNVTGLLRKHGFQGKNKIEVVCGINIYPPQYFCPMNYVTGKIVITNETYSIHHYEASWFSPYDKLKTFVRQHIGEKQTIFILKIKRKLRGKISKNEI